MVQLASGAQRPRQKFLADLLKADLNEVGKWHNSRPFQEQQRFLQGAKILQSKAQERRDEEDVTLAITGTSSGKQSLTTSLTSPASSAKLAQALKRSASCSSRLRSRGRNSGVGARARQKVKKEDDDAFQNWLEADTASSCTSATTASSRRTTFSQATKTDSTISICSAPGTKHQLDFRSHKRALAVNRNLCPVVNQHLDGALKDGIPHNGWPRAECIQTDYEGTYGDRHTDGQQPVTSGLYENVFKADQHDFVQGVLDEAPPKERKQVLGMVRSLEALRRGKEHQNRSMQHFDLDLSENKRWQNATQPPAALANCKTHPGLTSKSHEEPRPFSPPVSELGSIDLTRLTTPASSAAMEPASNDLCLSGMEVPSGTGLARKTRPLSAPAGAPKRAVQSSAQAMASAAAAGGIRAWTGSDSSSLDSGCFDVRLPRPASAVQLGRSADGRPDAPRESRRPSSAVSTAPSLAEATGRSNSRPSQRPASAAAAPGASRVPLVAADKPRRPASAAMLRGGQCREDDSISFAAKKTRKTNEPGSQVCGSLDTCQCDLVSVQDVQSPKSLPAKVSEKISIPEATTVAPAATAARQPPIVSSCNESTVQRSRVVQVGRMAWIQ